MPSATEIHKDLNEKALQCVHLARAIDQQYADPTKMSAPHAQERKALIAEAFRLRELAETAKGQAELEHWASHPDETQGVLAAAGAIAENKARITGGADAFAEQEKALNMQRFAKAMKLGAGALNPEEKAAIIEDATGQIIVPHDIAGPIFLTLPRQSVLRDLAFVRPTTAKTVDLRALTGVTAGWGQVEIVNAGGATPPTDAAIPRG